MRYAKRVKVRLWFMKKTYILSHAEARSRAMQAVRDAPEGYAISVSEPTRNLDQNAKLWPMLQEVADNVVWYGKKLSPESWKNIFSSSLKKQEVVPGLDGEFVVMGVSTSQMSKREFSELIELINAFMAEKGVLL